GGSVKGRRRGEGAGGGDGPKADRNGRGVGKRQDHIVGVNAPGIGHDLGKNRLHALALGSGSGRHEELARRIDPYRGALERANARALDVAADAETEVTALVSRRALALAKRGDAADPLESLP